MPNKKESGFSKSRKRKREQTSYENMENPGSVKAKANRGKLLS